MNNAKEPPGGRQKSKLLRSYRFSLAFENSETPDYITEKFFDALMSGAVPVYLGTCARMGRSDALVSGAYYRRVYICGVSIYFGTFAGRTRSCRLPCRLVYICVLSVDLGTVFGRVPLCRSWKLQDVFARSRTCGSKS